MEERIFTNKVANESQTNAELNSGGAEGHRINYR